MILNISADQIEADLGQIFLDYQGVMVSCSGHADSTALFHLTRHFLGAKKNLLAGLIHFNFGLRGDDSERDQVFVEELAKYYKISCQVFRVGQHFDHKGPDENLQNWARQVRLKVYRQNVAAGHAVALAHHLDDQAETVLMRLARGAGVQRLVGMKRLSEGIWRPLLHLPKHEIHRFLRENAWTHRIDATNDNINYSRNAIRHRVLPELEKLYPGAAERIVQTASDAVELADIAEEQVQLNTDDQGLWIATKWVRDARDPIALASLVALVTSRKQCRPQLSRKELTKFLCSLRRKPTGARIQLGRHGWLVDECGKVRWKDQINAAEKAAF